MAGPRPLVAPPAVVARDYGLLSVVQSRYEEADSHWRNGVTYQSICGTGAMTFDDYCVTGAAEQAPNKIGNISQPVRGATPFTVMVEIDCSAPGFTDSERLENAMGALTRVEGFQVERAFWTGTVAASGGYVAYPHLAANAEVYDSPGSLVSVLLQSAAAQVTGATLDVVEALGRLEAALGNCLTAQGVIHVTPTVFEIMRSQYLVESRAGVMYTAKGNKVAVGDGYTGSAPDGTSAAGVHWMYATSQIFAYRSTAETVGNGIKEYFDRSTNTVKLIVERTYVLGFDCCHAAVAVSLGGVVSGAYNSAT